MYMLVSIWYTMLQSVTSLKSCQDWNSENWFKAMLSFYNNNDLLYKSDIHYFWIRDTQANFFFSTNIWKGLLLQKKTRKKKEKKDRKINWLLYLKPKDFNYKLKYGCYIYTVHMSLHIAKYTCPLLWGHSHQRSPLLSGQISDALR